MPKFLYAFVSCLILITSLCSCGGSSNSGDMIINGTLLSEASSLNRTTAPVAGVEICCGGQCDVTDTTGTFSLATDVAASLYCVASGNLERSTRNMLNDEGFVIIGLGTEGLFLVEVTLTIDPASGAVQITTRTLTAEEQNPNTCGNGVAEGGNGEDCDGADLAGGDCRSLGFAAGSLSCSADCSYNTSQCDQNENGFCGDGIVDSPGEQCEGENLNGATCESEGFLAGTLSCSPDCMFDASACTDIVDPPMCGNGTVEAGEDCEGADLRGETCESLGYESGTLTCNTDCSYNESRCVSSSTPTCSESEKICGDTGSTPECLACSCDDGFPIGDCSATCLDTGSAPTVCSGGVGCSDGSDPVCPG